MTCDVCAGPSCGPRCPTCRRNSGDSPAVGSVTPFAVAPITRTDRRFNDADPADERQPC